AQDNAGHYSASHYFNLDIDSTPPTVTVGVHTAVSDTVTVVWQGEDRLSGVAAYQIEVQRGDGAWAPLVLEDATATTATVHFEEAEPPSVRVKAVDRVGNE